MWAVAVMVRACRTPKTSGCPDRGGPCPHDWALQESTLWPVHENRSPCQTDRKEIVGKLTRGKKGVKSRIAVGLGEVATGKSATMAGIDGKRRRAA